MTNQTQNRREVVGIISSRPDFDTVVKALLEAGFVHSDLSVLSSHDSLDAAGVPSWKDKLTGLLGELKYEGPLVTAGLIAIAAGPVGAVLGGVIAAGVGGAAAKEFFDEMTARPHAAEFASALAAGDVLLWVHAADDTREAQALAILQAAGATNVHTNERKG